MRKPFETFRQGGKLLLSFFLLASATLAQAEGIEFTEVETSADWEQTLAKAKSKGLAVFVDVYTDWCGYCKMMDRDVFALGEVGSYYNQHFINVKLNAETTFGEEFAYASGVDGYPTYLFINGEGKEISRRSGYMQPEVLLEAGKTVGESWEKLEKLEAREKAGKLTSAETAEYIVLIKESQPDKAADMAKKYIEGLAGEEMMRFENLKVIVPYTKSVDSRAWKYLSAQKADFVARHGQEFFNEFVGNMYNQLLQQAIQQTDYTLVETAMSEVLPIYLDNASELPGAKLVTRKLYYGNTGNFEEYQAVVEKQLAAAGAGEARADLLQAEAYELIDSYSVPEGMQVATSLLDRVEESEQGFEWHMLYAYALGIAGDFDAALQKAEECRQMAVGEEQVEVADQIIDMVKEARGN